MDGFEKSRLLAAYGALKDILNAADGDSPYLPQELLNPENDFLASLAALREVLIANGVIPKGEDV